MECSASIAGLQRAHVLTNSSSSSARISRVRFGATPKRCAVKMVPLIITAFQSQSHSLYDVLCVPQNGSARDIKTAYRRMALKYHPDVCPPAEKEECSRIFLQVQKSYETLSDPLLRQDYDWRLQNRLELSWSEERFDSNDYVWEAQLMELIRRRSGYDNNCSWSWGSRMRSRKQQAAAACG